MQATKCNSELFYISLNKKVATCVCPLQKICNQRDKMQFHFLPLKMTALHTTAVIILILTISVSFCPLVKSRRLVRQSAFQGILENTDEDDLDYSESIEDGSTPSPIDISAYSENLLELPKEDGWHCDSHADKNAHPQDCRKYYLCLQCAKESGWCYVPKKCPNDHYFDEVQDKCVATRQCPQLWTELPDLDGWSCNANDERHAVPGNCSQYYTCFECGRSRNWCYTQNQCAEGQNFNDLHEKCMDGRCYSWPAHLPKGWNCTDSYEENVNPTNCRDYYKCLPCPDEFPWCVTHHNCTNENEWFNDFSKQCRTNKLDVCPQDFLPLPDDMPGWQCKMEEDIHVNPDDCTQSYTCVKCFKSPNGWCYLPNKCPSEQYFDNTTKECAQGQTCPQNYTELPIGAGWHCEAENELNVVPGNCSQYYSCVSCNRPRKWCYISLECPADQTFDDDQMKCIPGRCPTYPPILPEDWTCEKENQFGAVPTDCHKFYKCLPCPDENPWCHISEDCENDKFFHNLKGSCVDTKTCPQDYLELPSERGWSCEMEGENNVHPKDCSQFYTCQHCSKPSGGWCYDTTICQKGSYFDQQRKDCVRSEMCPQDLNELPSFPGWQCDSQGQKNVVPDNCSDFYTCYPCDKPSEWCYTRGSCPEGQTFNAATGKCTAERCPSYPAILPTGWNCSVENELNVDPNDCSKFYKCLTCPDDNPWCYEHQSCADWKEGSNTFDDILNACVESTTCPQDLTEIGEGAEWECSEDGQDKAVPGDCSKFYKCTPCSRPRGWCYKEIESCRDEYTFDEFTGECYDGPCPQDRQEITDDLICPPSEGKFVLPTDCSKYYTCHSCNKPKGMCYQEHSCPANQTYDESNDVCVSGRCPQLDPIIPEEWTCSEDGEKNVLPTDCSKYYTCVPCEDGPWCYKSEQSCELDQTFDNTSKICSFGRCPQFPPILPEKWSCSEEGEEHVDPENCAAYFTCTNCPDSSSWCYRPSNCSDGQMYDDKIKKCVDEARCPQLNPLLPAEWNCTDNAERHVHPQDCSKFYICEKSGEEWTYKEVRCGHGKFFDDVNKMCVGKGKCPQDREELPQGWICEKDGDKHQNPEDCSQYYTCVHVVGRKREYWSYNMEYCVVGQGFNESSGNCEIGNCEQSIGPPIPLVDLPTGEFDSLEDSDSDSLEIDGNI